MLQPSLAPSLAECLAAPKPDFRRLATRIISEPQLIESLSDIFNLPRSMRPAQEVLPPLVDSSICRGPESSGLRGYVYFDDSLSSLLTLRLIKLK